MVGTVLAVAVALGVELAQPRVRSAGDLAIAMSVPVLSVLDSATVSPAEGKWRLWRRPRIRRGGHDVQLKVSEA